MMHTQPSGRAQKTLAIPLFAFAFLLVTLASASARAQSTGTRPPNATAGAPAGSYGLSGFENVNLFSGNLNFHLPLVGLVGRGDVKIPVMLSLDSTHWRLKRGKASNNGGDDAGRSISVGTLGFTVTEVWHYTALENPSNGHYWNVTESYTTDYTQDGTAWQAVIEPQPSYFWVDPYGFRGASPGYGPGVLQARTVSAGGRQLNDPNHPDLPGNTLTTVVFTTPDGTEYALYDKDSMGHPFHYATVPSGSQLPPHSRGTTFVSFDGGGATFISDAPVMEYFSYTTQTQADYPSALSGYLMLENGTRYRIEGGLVKWVRDRNGNVTAYDYTNGFVIKITDSIGRTVNFLYHVQVPAGTPCPYNTNTENDGTKCWYDEITTRGSGGATRTLRVWHAKLDRALRQDYASTGTYASLFPSYEQEPGADEPYEPADVKTAVELPDGRSYLFRYNPHNELARVVLPTGGATEYDYDTLTSPVNLQRAVRERRVYLNAGDTTPQNIQKYTRSLDGVGSNATVVTVTQQDGAGGAPLTAEKHYFYGNVVSGHLGFYSPWCEGKEYKTETMASDGETPLRRVENEFEARAYLGWCNSGQPQTYGPALDPRLRQTVTTLTDTTPNLSAKQLFYYDSDPALTYNLQTKVEEYGFDSELLRSTETEYLKSAAYADAPVHLRALPLRKSIYDAGHVERSRTTFEYDDYTHDPGTNNRHAPLVVYDDIFGLCTVFNAAGNYCSNADAASYATRGNATGTTSYLLDNVGNVTGSVTSNQQYDIAGNVVKSVDARLRPDGGGFETAFDFSDNFGLPDVEARSNTPPSALGSLRSYALPKLATNALGQTVYTQYDYYTGQAVNTEDINGTVSCIRYEDPLDRPTKAERAVNVPALRAQTTFHYDDAAHTITTTSDQKSYGDDLFKSEVIYDGLGRRTESRQYETPTQYISTLTKYDALGRASEVSNPLRPTLGESPVWTKTSYDALGRAWMVTTPDGAKGITHFDGVRTLVTDQAHKQRISRTDALGRLIEVWEVRPADATDTETASFPHYADVPDVAAGYKTAYKYDVMGNLRKVEQGAQGRFFAYDSLGRLLRVSNPEQDASASLALPANMLNSPADANNSWSIVYEYDEAGSLKKRADARGIETSYAYDALGRVTDRTYTDVHLPQGGTLTTPSVKYYYDAQPLPKGAPAFDRGKSLGHLVAVTYGGVTSTTGSYTGWYDELGRARYSSQVTLQPDISGQLSAQTYVFGYEYNLDGSLKSERYPSERVVASEYDSAGRLAGVKNQGGGYYAGGDPNVANNPNIIAYEAHGGVSALRLGNGLWEHTLYNERLQPYEIGLGTSRTDSSKLKLEYSYVPTVNGTGEPTRNNGNVQSQRISVPAEGLTPAQTFTQSYIYDALNRLESAYEVRWGAETWRQTYACDRYGNRRLDEPHTTKLNAAGATVYAVDSSNRPTTNPAIDASTNRITETGYTFDASGNLLCDPQHQCVSSPTFTAYFDYDAEGRMVRAAGEVQTGGSEYVYDGEGQRVEKVYGSLVTVFVYDADGQLVAEYSNQSVVGETSYLTQDALGSTRVVTGQGGNVQSRHDYLPFGEEINSTAVPNTGRESSQSYNYGTVRQKFTGYEHDDETELDFAKARYYANKQGRFTAIDPLMASANPLNPQTWNRYAYVSNNPLIMIDPTGERGDYYNRSGEWVFSDGKNDDKVYLVSGDGTTQVQYTELSITHTQFKIISNIIRQEGASDDTNEYLWIAHASNNEAKATGSSLYDLLQTGYSSVDPTNKTALATTDSSLRANATRAGVIDVLSGGSDPTGGARRWDGTDFLAWGLNAPNGRPHAKFRQFGTVAIPEDVFNSYVSNQGASSVRYGRTRYAIPADVFNRETNPNNWGRWNLNGNPVSGFLYVRDRNGGILYATGTAGKSIFWTVHYYWERN